MLVQMDKIAINFNLDATRKHGAVYLVRGPCSHTHIHHSIFRSNHHGNVHRHDQDNDLLDRPDTLKILQMSA